MNRLLLLEHFPIHVLCTLLYLWRERCFQSSMINGAAVSRGGYSKTGRPQSWR